MLPNPLHNVGQLNVRKLGFSVYLCALSKIMAVLLSSGNYFGSEIEVQQDLLFRLNITKYDPHEAIKEHYHENSYLSVLINGQYQEQNNDKKILINAGEVLFRPSGSLHANQFLKTGGKCFNIEWQQSWLDKHELEIYLPKEPAIFNAAGFDYLNQVLYCFANHQTVSLSEEYILLLLSKSTLVKVPARLPWLVKLKALIEHDSETHRTLHSLAQCLGLHPVYLARAFKEKQGLTVGEYQLKVRVRKAIELLYKTDDSINQIAYSAGFADAAHLIKAFRLHYQITPRKFRLALTR